MTVKFGVQFWLEEFDLEGLRNAFSEVENMGYESAWIYDHFYPMSNATSNYIFEPWTILPYLATETERLRLGILVTCNSYRYPSILAKMAATVDVISKGRLEFGIGAGWHEVEYDAYGIQFPSAKVRLEQMDEAIELIKRIWTQEKANFEGKHYMIRDLIALPKPIQKPYPPIMIGGSGNMLLKIAAQHADNMNLVNLRPEKYAERLEVFKNNCSEIGRNFDDIIMSFHCNAMIGEKEEIKSKVQNFKKESNVPGIQKMDLEGLLGTMIVGTPEECIEKIQRYIDSGVRYFVIHFPYPGDLKSLRIFMNKVIPSFE